MYRGLCCAVGPAIPPPTPTPAHGTHCPPIGRFAAASAAASGPGASAPSAHAASPHQCPARFLSGPYIPLSTSPIQVPLPVQRVACLPNRSDGACRSPRPAVTVVANLNPGRTDHGRRFVGFRRSCARRSVRTALPPAACPPLSCDTSRAPARRAGSFNSGKPGDRAFCRPKKQTSLIQFR
jgi:hypothetical protein